MAKLAETKEKLSWEGGRWPTRKEEFINSEEFFNICSGKELELFELGFKGYAGQFPANGFPKVEYPCPFLEFE